MENLYDNGIENLINGNLNEEFSQDNIAQLKANLERKRLENAISNANLTINNINKLLGKYKISNYLTNQIKKQIENLKVNIINNNYNEIVRITAELQKRINLIPSIADTYETEKVLDIVNNKNNAKNKEYLDSLINRLNALLNEYKDNPEILLPEKMIYIKSKIIDAKVNNNTNVAINEITNIIKYLNVKVTKYKANVDRNTKPRKDKFSRKKKKFKFNLNEFKKKFKTVIEVTGIGVALSATLFSLKDNDEINKEELNNPNEMGQFEENDYEESKPTIHIEIIDEKKEDLNEIINDIHENDTFKEKLDHSINLGRESFQEIQGNEYVSIGKNTVKNENDTIYYDTNNIGQDVLKLSGDKDILIQLYAAYQKTRINKKETLNSIFNEIVRKINANPQEYSRFNYITKYKSFDEYINALGLDFESWLKVMKEIAYNSQNDIDNDKIYDAIYNGITSYKFSTSEDNDINYSNYVREEGEGYGRR